jgi:hypothetical protein
MVATVSILGVSSRWVNGRISTVSAMHEDHVIIKKADDPTKQLRVERIQRPIPYTAYQRTQFPINVSLGVHHT